mmetsp:Transcript_30655/g.37908  ORF Transcript_30655/g.37908 Transcript_30655/m.37908 type:complete len:233 (-) Transcript_30655:751-1449(-)
MRLTFAAIICSLLVALFIIGHGESVLLEELGIVAVVLEPLSAERVDHDGTQGCGEHDGEDSSRQHRLTILNVLGDVAFLGLRQSEAAQSSLHRGLRDPGEGHERALLVVVLLLESHQEGSQPASRHADANYGETVADHGRLQLVEKDGSSDCAEEERLAEHPEDGQLVLGLVFAPVAEAHEAEEDDEDEFGLGEAGQVGSEGSCDRKCDDHEELWPLRLLGIAPVKEFHRCT